MALPKNSSKKKREGFRDDQRKPKTKKKPGKTPMMRETC
jgi:hypothetical protein